jgi:hypothetical protein
MYRLYSRVVNVRLIASPLIDGFEGTAGDFMEAPAEGVVGVFHEQVEQIKVHAALAAVVPAQELRLGVLVRLASSRTYH